MTCTDYRVVLCETCGSEGRILRRSREWEGEHCHDHGERDYGRCEQCEGTGGEIIPVEPVDEPELWQPETITAALARVQADPTQEDEVI